VAILSELHPRRMTRLRDEQGMTLPELLIALVIAMVISLATFGLIETVMSRAGEIATRVDTTQRARHAMDIITRQLRSQVCVTSTNPNTVDPRAIVSATPTSISFFTDLSDESHYSGSTTKNPELRTISYENNKLLERRWTGVKGGLPLNPTYSYSGFPTSSFSAYMIADNVEPIMKVNNADVVFRYYSSAGELPMPITAVAAASITRVTMSFRAYRARGKGTDRGFTVLQNTVYARHTDPNVANPRPTCA
jgi:prepilin-type N-terminal cleavage/methylation domain-containing protein